MNANIDLEKLQKYALNTWLFKQGEMVSLVIHLGHRLGLYEAMDGAGMITAEELSGSTRCHERWILEWLRCNAAAGLIETSDGINFRLEPEGAAVLAQSDKPTYAAAVFANLKPIEVVLIQLNGLKKNDEPNIDNGIKQTWEFAHPRNKMATGPLPKFANMIRTPAYSILLNNLKFEIL